MVIVICFFFGHMVTEILSLKSACSCLESGNQFWNPMDRIKFCYFGVSRRWFHELANDVGFSSSSDGFNMVSSGSSGKVQKASELPTLLVITNLKFQTILSHSCYRIGQKQFHSIRGSLGAMGTCKIGATVEFTTAAAPPHVQAVYSGSCCTDELLAATAAATFEGISSSTASNATVQQQNLPVRSVARPLYEPGTESLAQFPCRTRPFSGLHSSDQQPPEKKQHTRPTSNDDLHSAFQNSVNSRIENQMTSPGSPYTGTFVQIPSAVSSTTLTLAQLNPSSPFSCLTPSSSNNPQSSHNMLAASTAINHVSSAHSPVQTPMEQSSQSNEVDPNEFQSSVEKIIQEMMISSQFSGAGGMVSVDYEGNDIKDINRVTRSTQNVFTSGPCLEGNVMGNKKSGTMDGGFGSLNGQNHLSASTSRFTAAMGNVSSILSGRLAMPVMDHDAGMNHQQQALAYQLRLGAVNRFLDNQFD
ncbi:hypothetical protein D5086_010048 [Populus alba]|uniref:Uncharacterized protein n=1 Tax=Populus alba TaxID=43335 RepID=A0ACC4C9Z5_POPAL